jgi:hypothetical protein
MKQWLKKKIRNFLEDDTESADLTIKEEICAVPSTSVGSFLEPLRFCVYEAAGGRVVEVSYYDRKADRNCSQLHIITSDEDFGQSLAQIVMLENMRR